MQICGVFDAIHFYMSTVHDVIIGTLLLPICIVTAGVMIPLHNTDKCIY